MSTQLDKTKALRAVLRHCKHVKSALRKVIGILQDRVEMHDVSKLNDDEFEAVTHYQKLDGLAYGSKAYDEKMSEIRSETGAGWQLHCERNSHHPEHHRIVDDMGFLDIIEMVCDWKGANAAYNTSGQSFREGALACIERYDFHIGQKWLIHQLIDVLDDTTEVIQNEAQTPTQ